MDLDAITTSVKYELLREQHFNGGYFSDDVREEAQRLNELNTEEKKILFRDTFNALWEQAIALKSKGTTIPGYFPKRTMFDLTEHHLGEIGLDLSSADETEAAAEDISAYKGIDVWVESFNPVPRRHEEYINAPGDELGLETGGPTMVKDDQEPRGWGDGIYANFDGSFPAEHTDTLDYEIMRLLDAKETLDIIAQKLSTS